MGLTYRLKIQPNFEDWFLKLGVFSLFGIDEILQESGSILAPNSFFFVP